MKTYPVVDRIPGEKGFPYNTIRAVATGEVREPKKGEWYLSGAIIKAYRAPNNLSQKYHIARLVRVQAREVEILSEYP